jgi:hypothetical protein
LEENFLDNSPGAVLKTAPQTAERASMKSTTGAKLDFHAESDR